MIKQPIIDANKLESICKIIASTENGLTGSEIGHMLPSCNLKDVSPGSTKWKRLFDAFAVWQNEHQYSNNILKFIQTALDPVRYIGNEGLFQDKRHEINKRLSFIGHELTEAGKYKLVEKANTIAEAEQRANKFKYKLQNRNVHQTVFKYCSAELLVENYFHSVFEATKSVADRLRDLTQLTSDGNQLADTVFSTDKPFLKINDLKDATDRSEHIGLANLIKGIFGLVRNSTAHEPKIKFAILEEEALDIMTTISYIHKKLDNTKTS